MLKQEKKSIRDSVYIWGTGNGANVAVMYCIENDIRIEGFIDSNPSMQIYNAGYVIAETVDTEYEYMPILSPASLFEKKTEEIYVIIAALKRYVEITEMLMQKGDVKYCLVQDLMEDCKYIVDDALKREYAVRCAEYFDIQRNTILFSSYGNYTDHEKYISEALSTENNSIERWWLVSDLNYDMPRGIKKIWRGNWKAVIRAYETASVWVQDLAIDTYIIKRMGQKYIQTKHWASLTFKRFYLDTKAFDKIDSNRERWLNDGRLIDFIVTGSELDRNSCRRGMSFDGHFLDFGSPRTDALFRIDVLRRKVFKYYSISLDNKVLMYAPTYRFDRILGNDHHISRKLQLDYDMIKKALETRFGGKWIIMLRLHPSVRIASDGFERKDYVINASFYEDSEELVAASDIVVTDFSSIGMEPAFVKRISMLFATDLDIYIENEYELLLDYRSLPFPIAETNEQLAENILNFDQEKYETDVTAFLDKYGVHEDGHASERAADFILGLLEDSEQ